MMYGWAQSGNGLLLHLHWLFAGLAAFGFVVALIWLYKEAKATTLKTVMWWTLVIGIVGALLTAPLAMREWNSWMGNHRGFFPSVSRADAEKWQQLSEEDHDKIFDEMRDHMEWMWGLDEATNSKEKSQS